MPGESNPSRVLTREEVTKLRELHAAWREALAWDKENNIPLKLRTSRGPWREYRAYAQKLRAAPKTLHKVTAGETWNSGDEPGAWKP